MAMAIVTILSNPEQLIYQKKTENTSAEPQS